MAHTLRRWPPGDRETQPPLAMKPHRPALVVVAMPVENVDLLLVKVNRSCDEELVYSSLHCSVGLGWPDVSAVRLNHRPRGFQPLLEWFPPTRALLHQTEAGLTQLLGSSRSVAPAAHLPLAGAPPAFAGLLTSPPLPSAGQAGASRPGRW